MPVITDVLPIDRNKMMFTIYISQIRPQIGSYTDTRIQKQIVRNRIKRNHFITYIHTGTISGYSCESLPVLGGCVGGGASPTTSIGASVYAMSTDAASPTPIHRAWP